MYQELLRLEAMAHDLLSEHCIRYIQMLFYIQGVACYFTLSLNF
uniref:Uncharacterized protein n=1 Tax=Arundo donax TaxID=35708 RepID=A0A0A8Y1T1_ARUDO